MVKLIPATFNPFEIYPEFRSIWPHRTEVIEECLKEFLIKPWDGLEFLITLNDVPIGITGCWVMDKTICLNWHGIIPSEQKKGYSKQALLLVIEEVKKKYPIFNTMTECIPQDREKELRGYFESMGFKGTGKVIKHPELYDQVIWMEYVFYLKD